MTASDNRLHFSDELRELVGGPMSDEKGRVIDPGPSKAGSHRLADAAKCLRKHFLKRERARHQPSSTWTTVEPFVKGTLVHLGLAQMYARMYCRQHDRDEDEFLDPIDAMNAKAQDYRAPPIWRAVLDDCVYSFQSYRSRWELHDEARYDIIAIEKQYEISVTDPDRDVEYCYTQRLDLGVREKSTGGVIFWDHKTTMNYQSWIKYRYELALQFVGYNALGALHYPDFKSTQINYIQLAGEKKSKSKPPTRIQPEFYRPTANIAPAAGIQDLRWKVIQVERNIADFDPDTNPNIETPLDVPGAYDQRICRSSKDYACEFYELCHSRRGN